MPISTISISKILFIINKLVTFFTKEVEHIFLIDFNTWLIEWINVEEIGTHRTSSHEEVEEITEVKFV